MAQEVKNDIKKALQVNTIPLIAIMTAVTTVLTMLVKIPTPIRGYLNLSDTMIYFSAYAFGPWVGGIIGGLGPALSDLISGYPQWAIPTAIIKAFNAVPFVLCRMAMKKHGKDNKIINWSSLLMLIPTTMVTVGGYFIANGLMYGFEGAVAELATWWLQPGMGALIFIVLGFALDRIDFKKKLALK